MAKLPKLPLPPLLTTIAMKFITITYTMSNNNKTMAIITTMIITLRLLSTKVAILGPTVA